MTITVEAKDSNRRVQKWCEKPAQVIVIKQEFEYVNLEGEDNNRVLVQDGFASEDTEQHPTDAAGFLCAWDKKGAIQILLDGQPIEAEGMIFTAKAEHP